MRVGIIGCGRMGRRHMLALKNLGYQIVGAFDSSLASLESTGAEFKLSKDKLYDNLKEFYSHSNLDAVIISTNADSHCYYTCISAEYGVKFILVEKPMATSLDDCDLMIQVCQSHGAKLGVNHQMQFMEQYIEPKRLLATDAYGGFASMTVVAGNFGVSMNGSHYFEAFRFMTDEDPYEVTAWFSGGELENPRGKSYSDRAGSVRISTRSGKRFYLETGYDQGHGVFVTYCGRYGVLIVNELTGDLFLSEREPGYRDLPTSRYGMPAINAKKNIQPVDVVITSGNVFSALINSTDNSLAIHGRLAVEVLVATYQSVELGSKAIRLGDALDKSKHYPWA